MVRANVHVALGVLAGLIFAAAASAATESETFGTAAGATAHGWTSVTTATQNLGFRATNNAGGAAGEGGGTSQRSTDTGYYADTTVGTQHFGTDTLTATANFAVNNNAGFSGLDLVGFFDKNKVSGLQANWVGLLLTDNNASSFRIGSLIAHDPTLSASGEDSFDSGPLAVLSFSTPYTLTMSTNGKDLTTTVTRVSDAVQVYNSTVTSTSVNANVDNFNVNAFGLIGGGSSSASGSTWDAFIDNVTYSTVVPEPASISVLAGGLLLGIARRRR